MRIALLCVLAVTRLEICTGFSVSTQRARVSSHQSRLIFRRSRLHSEKENGGDERVSFDDAGRSLIDQQEKESFEQMGDLDDVPGVSQENAAPPEIDSHVVRTVLAVY